MRFCIFVASFYFFNIIVCNAKTDSEVLVLSDVIRAMEKPSTVVATLCWQTNKKVDFYNAVTSIDRSRAATARFDDMKHAKKDYGQDQHMLFVADLKCPNISAYFDKKKEEQYFRSPFRWILISSSENDEIVPNEIAYIDLLPDSEVIVLRQIEADTYDLHFIYKISPNSDWRTQFYGSWNLEQRFVKTNQQLVESTALQRLDLLGFEMSICYVLTDNDSINHLTDEVNDHIDTITKVNFPTTNHLLDFLNASRKYIFAETWGYRVNGSWNGMTGYLLREEVEIGGSPMFFTSERISVVDYIASPTPTRSKFVFQQPKLSYENNLFLLSFRTSVWYSSTGLIFLLLLALFAVAVWEWKKNSHHIYRKQDSGILRANFVDVIILIFGAICQQGSPVELKGSLGRVVMLILFLALMFLYTSYSANIVALLQSSSSQIRTLDDLLHSRLKFGVHDTVFNRYYFSTATEPVRKAIYEKKVAPPGTTSRFMSMEEGVKKMRKGLFAFHMETGVGYKFVGKYFNEGEKCGLREIQYLQVIDPWLAVRKNTPYREMFKIGMKRIQEHGLQARENRLLYEKRPKCSGRESNFVSVSMVDCYPALLILSYGSLVSLTLLIFEFLYHKRETIIHKLKHSNRHSM
ncbi:ionotropic receptor 75a-like isoform X1 [Ostrinia furnacalis]|uniref:ionotropic receptor 75a-like isoform X1 n=1 Tax=Ostrinia furnacalis TaxID=93504 RepID=UPI00103D73C1|nr:ionotropic receptor 75a-like isoform X1 [Ostrinia furnacalis]